MIAFQVGKGGHMTVRDDVAQAEPGSAEVLVQTMYSAICGSDIHSIFDTPISEDMPPGYPGHESIGRIVKSKSTRFHEDQIVLVVPDMHCNRSFAEYQAVPDRFVLATPDCDPRLLVMAQQLGTADFALRRFLSSEPHMSRDVCLVYGAGSAGLHFVSLLRLEGFQQIVVADVDQRRTALALAHGATDAVDPRAIMPSDFLMERTHGRGASLVIEAAGKDASRADAVASLACRGTLGLFGLPQSKGPSRFPIADFFRKRATILAASGAQGEPELASFRRALRWIADGTVSVDYMVSKARPLTALIDALHAARGHTSPSVKTLVTTSDDLGDVT